MQTFHDMRCFTRVEIFKIPYTAASSPLCFERRASLLSIWLKDKDSWDFVLPHISAPWHRGHCSGERRFWQPTKMPYTWLLLHNAHWVWSSCFICSWKFHSHWQCCTAYGVWKAKKKKCLLSRPMLPKRLGASTRRAGSASWVRKQPLRKEFLMNWLGSKSIHGTLSSLLIPLWKRNIHLFTFINTAYKCNKLQ